MFSEQQIEALVIPSMEYVELNSYLDKAIQSMKEGNELDAINQLRSGLISAYNYGENEWVTKFSAYLSIFI